MEATMRCDVLIAGCGVAGLCAALNLPRGLDVVMLSKGALEECDSMLAQGGVCVQRDDGDYDDFYDDTMRAGRFENCAESVDAMIRESRSVIDDLVRLGVRFDTDEDGSMSYTREAAHSRARICHCADATGREITEKMLEAVRRLPNVRIFEHTALVDVLESGGACAGGIVEHAGGETVRVSARWTILATGGIGGLYELSTNYPLLTGDALLIARRHGVEVRDVDYVQFHPTALHAEGTGRAFLITESARGEGAVLLDSSGERFTDELAPRDVVTAAIRAKMAEEGSSYVRLSFAGLDPDWVRGRFPTIYRRCLAEGIDIAVDPIPVAPAQHYHMGGVRTDIDGRTSLPGLFAVGECACNGVHGRNRLASNSLLEAMVFARRAAHWIERAEDQGKAALERGAA